LQAVLAPDSPVERPMTLPTRGPRTGCRGGSVVVGTFVSSLDASEREGRV